MELVNRTSSITSLVMELVNGTSSITSLVMELVNGTSSITGAFLLFWLLIKCSDHIHMRSHCDLLETIVVKLTAHNVNCITCSSYIVVCECVCAFINSPVGATFYTATTGVYHIRSHCLLVCVSFQLVLNNRDLASQLVFTTFYSDCLSLWDPTAQSLFLD
jgi:hypothetical protein